MADSLDEAKAAFRAAGERAVGPDGLTSGLSNSPQESSEHGRVGIALSLSEKIGELLHVPPDVSYLEAPAAFLGLVAS